MDTKLLLKRRGRPVQENSVRSIAKKVKEQTELLQQDITNVEDNNMIKPSDIIDTPEITSPIESNITEEIKDEQESKVIDDVPQVVEESTEEQKDNTDNTVIKQEKTEPVLEEMVDVKQDNGFTMLYKYAVNSIVYVPQYEQIQHIDEFGIIRPKYGFIPVSVKISEVCYSNKITYRFYGKPKLIVVENYIRETIDDCQALCEQLNNQK